MICLAYLAIVASVLPFGWCYLEYDSWINIELQHALDVDDPKNFSYRGNATITSLNSGNANTVQEALSDHQRRSLKILAQNNGFYRLQATVVYASGHKETFLSSTRACSLLLAQLYDVLWISIDSAGFVNGVTSTTSGSEKCSNLHLSTSGLEDFNTDVVVRHTELAPIPDTASFIQKLEREREARERGDVRDNRGFFAKYILAQNNGFYRLQATVVYASGHKETFLSSTRACSLLLAQLYDVLWISIDSAGFVNGVTSTTSGSEKCSNLHLSTSGLEDFNTDVVVRHTELAPIPDTASFIQKLEREREARERGDVRDNRGFFAKYWMYIVPVVLLLFISGATNHDGAK